MGRGFNPRNGRYDADATVVLRVVRAIEADTSVTNEWKQETVNALREAARLLLEPRLATVVMGRAKKASSG